MVKTRTMFFAAHSEMRVNNMKRKKNEFAAKVWAAVQDLPVFLTAPLYRRWHLRWGATDTEVAHRCPGMIFTRHAQYRTTRAITIDAPPEAAWPWLVQVGGGRAGFYSNDLLDNLGRSSATTIVPALQHLETGQRVPMSPSGVPTPQTAFKFHSFATEEWTARKQDRVNAGPAQFPQTKPRRSARHPPCGDQSP